MCRLSLNCSKVETVELGEPHDLTQKPKVGIVGGCGFLGNDLAMFLRESFNVKALDKRKPMHDLEGVEYEYCDITRYDDVRDALKDVDLVIHAAIVQIPEINENPRLGYETNVTGTKNICEVIDANRTTRGMIVPGSWHTIGEKDLAGRIDEEFGFRPDKVEDRARLYALSKICQESIVRLHDEVSEKIFGIIRIGTLLGKNMSEKTAANIFIENGLRGEPITPFKHTMHRPMLYVDISDVCRAFEKFAIAILDGKIEKGRHSLAHIFNVYYPDPVTILELAHIVKETIIELVPGARPEIRVVETGQEPMFRPDDKIRIRPDITKAVSCLGLTRLKSPRESIREIVRNRVEHRVMSKRGG
jgi:UDP-glucose 4-epimerase